MEFSKIRERPRMPGGNCEFPDSRFGSVTSGRFRSALLSVCVSYAYILVLHAHVIQRRQEGTQKLSRTATASCGSRMIANRIDFAFGVTWIALHCGWFKIIVKGKSSRSCITAELNQQRSFFKCRTSRDAKIEPIERRMNVSLRFICRLLFLLFT